MIDERAADAAVVRHLRALADPDAVVDDAAEVLGEVPLDLWRDAADGLVQQNVDARVGRGTRARRQQQPRTSHRAGGDELASVYRHLGWLPAPFG